ncbi:MAG: hypothetical protein DMG98_20455, partial [Acidobacteria bacterium]
HPGVCRQAYSHHRRHFAYHADALIFIMRAFRHIQQRWIIRCQLARTIITITELGYVDDDPSKKDLKIDGIPVIGNVDEIPQLVGRYHVDEILIAVPSASGRRCRFVEICERAEVKFRRVPALRDIIAGRMNINQFRDVRVETCHRVRNKANNPWRWDRA